MNKHVNEWRRKACMNAQMDAWMYAWMDGAKERFYEAIWNQMDLLGWPRDAVLIKAELVTIHDGGMKAKAQYDPEGPRLWWAAQLPILRPLQYPLSALAKSQWIRMRAIRNAKWDLKIKSLPVRESSRRKQHQVRNGSEKRQKTEKWGEEEQGKRGPGGGLSGETGVWKTCKDRMDNKDPQFLREGIGCLLWGAERP